MRVRIFVDQDGSVTFADLLGRPLLRVAERLAGHPLLPAEVGSAAPGRPVDGQFLASLADRGEADGRPSGSREGT